MRCLAARLCCCTCFELRFRHAGYVYAGMLFLPYTPSRSVAPMPAAYALCPLSPEQGPALTPTPSAPTSLPCPCQLLRPRRYQAHHRVSCLKVVPISEFEVPRRHTYNLRVTLQQGCTPPCRIHILCKIRWHCHPVRHIREPLHEGPQYCPWRVQDTADAQLVTQCCHMSHLVSRPCSGAP